MTSVGDTFRGTDRFRPLSLIGRGAMGAVYRVRDTETGAVVALKTLNQAAPEAIYRLKNEFRSLAGIVHPNLVQLYDLFVDDEVCFFTMEYVGGCDFVRHVRAGEEAMPVRLGRFLLAAPQLLRGLAALHGAGRLHRDVKPSNVLVTPAGEVKLLDFDLSLITTGSETGQPEAAGSVAYIAPEQAWGAAIRAAADLYAAGVVFYEALTGALPFDGPPAQVLVDKASRPSPPLTADDAPDWICEIVARLLSIQPKDRPPLELLLDRFGAMNGGSRVAASAPWVRRRETEFVGRASEQRALQAAYERFVGNRRPAAVHVHGTSGIGKTELVRHFVDHLESACGALVFSGRCHPQESVPYKALDPVVDAISRFLLAHGDVLGDFSRMELNALARLFPVLARVPPVSAARRRESVDAVELRQRGFRAFRRLLTAIGDGRSLVVWIDDLQWGDTDSAVLLRELLSPPAPPKVLLLLSYRSEDREHTAMLPLLAQLETGSEPLPVGEIEVGPMEPGDALDLAEKLCGGSGTAPRDLSMIVSQSGGSPFFIAEISRQPAGREGRPLSDLGEVVRQRLDGLPPEARAIAELAAVAAAPIDRSLLLQASKRGEAARPLVALLESECVVRAATAAGDVVQPYHDRIREAVVAQLSAAAKARCHLDLATTFESRGRGVEPELLARHFHGAGLLPKAADYAVAAADKAANAFAFVHAAELYRSAREWDGRDEAWRRTLLTREGDSLANATRFLDGARAFLAAAEDAPRLERLELRRNAAEHLISAGAVDEGLRTLTAVLREIGLRYPRTPATAMLSMGGGLLWLRVRGLRPRARREDATAEDLLRVDTCYSAGKSLVDADSIRGVYFSLQALRHALEAGDPIRLGRSLAVLGPSLSVFPGAWIQRLGERMTERAEVIAAETGSPLLRGTIDVCRGQVMMMGGDWRGSLSRLDEGVRVLTEQCRGAAFEALVGRTMALRPLEELGELAELEKRGREIGAISRALGNRYAELGVSDHLIGVLITSGRIEEARERVRQNLELWTVKGFHLQHLYSIRREVLCDLYEGQAARGYERLLGIWKQLQRSQLLRVSLPRVDTAWLRGRLALAVGGTHGLKDAAGCAKQLAGEGRPDAAVYTLLLQAGLRSAERDDVTASSLWRKAIQAAEKADMRLHATAARYRRGRSLGGAEDDPELREVEAAMMQYGVADAERWAMVYAPAGAVS